MKQIWHLLTVPFRRGPRRPLAARQPEREEKHVPLGMEALDMNIVDAVNRKNNALERATGVFHRRNLHRSGIAAADTTVSPLSDDETYAARYYSAYIKRDD